MKTSSSVVALAVLALALVACQGASAQLLQRPGIGNGQLFSRLSGGATVCTAVKPAAPRALTATPDNGRVLVNWQPAAGNACLTGYELSVRRVDDSEHGRTDKFTVGANQLAAVLANLANATPYTVSVRAIAAGFPDTPAATVVVTPKPALKA